ncbi:DUF4209 domain-containing protein [Bradyrhizobium sp. CCGUVB1N3]|uniref:DUF4209 domain-containing protein n=1 Tax=Bradyrhizobium sp. CCGUVB1N3 TaxID=2949629 RepID=UPI0020B2D878|nr:DUF4209 domain-containing protein [Bradyrhizobium sp. CCGUVB1N3]MCP3477627.1 DUF4209 domain-containing protein [Bradyrhizobium sp. CCGUVB1N3]
MDDTTAGNAATDEGEASPQPVLWARATLADLAGVDFEDPVEKSDSADSAKLSDLFRAAVGAIGPNGELPDTPSTRLFHMLAAATGMMFRSSEPNEPFGAMMVRSDGLRTALPIDFRGPPAEVMAEMALHARHPVLRARLADIGWVIDRNAQLAAIAAEAYADIVAKVEAGELRFRGENDRGVLTFEARDLLRRALLIGRAIGADKPGPAAARDIVTRLRMKAFGQGLMVPSLWFGHLALDFGVGDAGEIGGQIEALIGRLPDGSDPHTIVNLWRMAARAYRIAKKTEDQHRSQSAAAEQLVDIAANQPMAIIASQTLTEAIAELHGVPGKKDRRKELRHRLIDVQAGIVDEMSGFTIPTDLEEIARWTEQQMQHPLLRDKLFSFAALARSPDPADLEQEAREAIREHPLSSLFGSSHHDREGKVVHRSAGAGFGDGTDASAIERQVALGENIRRHHAASGKIEVARRRIVADHYISDDMLADLLAHSPFVPRNLVMSYSRGFTRFFQGDFVSAVYVLTPLLEQSLRHVLKNSGYDVTKLNDATKTQEDRTISSLFEQMRTELVSIFGDSIVADIENVFLKKMGPNLRNRLSHGLLSDGDPYGDDAIYGCWLIFHLCMLPLFEFRSQLTLPFDRATEDQSSRLDVAAEE